MICYLLQRTGRVANDSKCYGCYSKCYLRCFHRTAREKPQKQCTLVCASDHGRADQRDSRSIAPAAGVAPGRVALVSTNGFANSPICCTKSSIGAVLQSLQSNSAAFGKRMGSRAVSSNPAAVAC
jgi:hypothetical protein